MTSNAGRRDMARIVAISEPESSGDDQRALLGPEPMAQPGRNDAGLRVSLWALSGTRPVLPLADHSDGAAAGGGHLGLAKIYGRTGKRQETQEHLGAATTMYREMDMRFWLEQAETEITALA